MDDLPQARVFCTDVQWFYQFGDADPVGPFLSAIEAVARAREIIIALAERCETAQKPA